MALDFNIRKNHKIKGPINTLAVLVMENCSFDHVLGWLKSIRPEIDRLTGKESNWISVSNPDSLKVPVSNDAIYVDWDPGHSFQAIRKQIFRSNSSSVNPTPMNELLQQAESMGEGMLKTSMRGFKPEVLLVYTELANEFLVFDRWFVSVPTSTQSSRFYVHSTTSHGCMFSGYGFRVLWTVKSLRQDYTDEFLEFGCRRKLKRRHRRGVGSKWGSKRNRRALH